MDHPRSRGVYSTSGSRTTPWARIIPARAGFTASPGRAAGRPRDHPRSRGVYPRSGSPTTATTGSSPLARGLRPAEIIWSSDRRIIPARAGFTRRRHGLHVGGEDHPRSRGVYPVAGLGPAGLAGSSPLARGLRPGRGIEPRCGRIIPARAGFTGCRPALPGGRGGSSPLARGLREGDGVVSHRRGIIPARAGFTRSGGRRHRRRTDHPRSRGVYRATPMWRASECGSSPLARGLPPLQAGPGGPAGIIPARAGFTGPPGRRRRRRQDHPRSRGVYPGRWRGRGAIGGSSPLARGLRLEPGSPLASRRIIPARAGVTSQVAPRDRAVGDHPRSRGVYSAPSGTGSKRPGSSPLARGLRLGRQGPWGPAGIIPARAGFTPRPARPRGRRRDHPRSRGVYRSWIRSWAPGLGSSPLARGLHPPAPPGLWPPRIIPARAGFTRCGTLADRMTLDHPRSRGVYGGSSIPPGLDCGSSPLARGLPARPRAGDGGGGIIPARAGFTDPAAVDVGGREDHPRSRGVYATTIQVLRSCAGSSPLARGLLLGAVAGAIRGGIIPARAGFTDGAGGGPPSSGDHPRSRGVYPQESAVSDTTYGSSPLARGLPTPATPPSSPPRIIPARAGFTTTAPRGPTRTWDHPRSRGVYGAPTQDAGMTVGSSPLARGLRPLRRGRRGESGIIPARAGFTRPADGDGAIGTDHPRSRGVYSGPGRRSPPPRGSSPLARGLLHGGRHRNHRRGIIPARAGFT